MLDCFQAQFKMLFRNRIVKESSPPLGFCPSSVAAYRVVPLWKLQLNWDASISGQLMWSCWQHQWIAVWCWKTSQVLGIGWRPPDPFCGVNRAAEMCIALDQLESHFCEASLHLRCGRNAQKHILRTGLDCSIGPPFLSNTKWDKIVPLHLWHM